MLKGIHMQGRIHRQAWTLVVHKNAVWGFVADLGPRRDQEQEYGMGICGRFSPPS